MLRIPVPTCDATLASTIPIPAGAFIYGGVGEPPSQFVANDRDDKLREEHRLSLTAYRIDRTEVTNAAFAVFASMAQFTDIAAPRYPPGGPELAHAGEPRRPITGITWHLAHAYCRYLGKELPSSQQWVKAMRGGETVDGKPNPMPRRNLPWGVAGDPHRSPSSTASKASPTSGPTRGREPVRRARSRR